MSYSIQTSALTKRFPQQKGLRSLLRPRSHEHVVAVDGVTMSIAEGELFGLLGPNGAGKTTLIKLLCTLVVPTSGEALVNGFRLSDGEKVRRQIGLVTGEERSFYWRLSGRDNLRFYGSLYGLSVSEADRRVAELSGLLGLGEFLDQRFGTYSAGMKQRLALARGLLNDAEIILLDEPTKSLDPGAAMRLRETIHDLSGEHGHTVVLVTHQLGEAAQLCDRIGIMHRGRLTVADEVSRLRDLVRPESRYRLDVVGLTGDAARRLEQVEGIVDLVEEQCSEERVLLDLRVEEGGSSLTNVLRVIVENGAKVESVRTEDVTLEEIFEEFTGRQANAGEAERQHISLAPQVSEGLRSAESTVVQEMGVLDAVRDGLRKVWAFVCRDLKLQASYRLAFFFQSFGILFSVASFYFVALLFGEAAVPHLQAYGGDYFSFVVVGIAFMRYQGVAMGTFATTIRRGQMMGTLEAMLVTPTRLSTILVASSVWSFVFASIQVLLYLLLGVLVFGVDLSRANLAAALVVQILTVLAFSGLGILSASFIMVFKQGDPISFLFGSVSTLLGGVLYPIAVLPGWLQPISYLIPLTYSLNAMRRAILLGDPLSALAADLLPLVLFAVILLPLSFVAFRYAVKRAKIEGSLTQY